MERTNVDGINRNLRKINFFQISHFFCQIKLLTWTDNKKNITKGNWKVVEIIYTVKTKTQ